MYFLGLKKVELIIKIMPFKVLKNEKTELQIYILWKVEELEE